MHKIAAKANMGCADGQPSLSSETGRRSYSVRCFECGIFCVSNVDKHIDTARLASVWHPAIELPENQFGAPVAAACSRKCNERLRAPSILQPLLRSSQGRASPTAKARCPQKHCFYRSPRHFSTCPKKVRGASHPTHLVGLPSTPARGCPTALY